MLYPLPPSQARLSSSIATKLACATEPGAAKDQSVVLGKRFLRYVAEVLKRTVVVVTFGGVAEAAEIYGFCRGLVIGPKAVGCRRWTAPFLPATSLRRAADELCHSSWP